MSNGLTRSGGLLLDVPNGSGRPDRMRVEIDGYEDAFDSSRVIVSEVYIPTGWRKGHAIFTIQNVSRLGETANQVVFSTLWESLLFGMRVVISRQAGDSGSVSKFWVGRIAVVEADVGKDMLTVTAYDDRWMFENVFIVGRWVLNPGADDKASTDMTYQQGWPAVFNPGGRPNMILSKAKVDGVAVPVFAPHPDYGLENDEAVPTDPTKAEKKACYWTMDYIFRYLCYFYGPAAKSLYTPLKVEAPITTPQGILWSAGIAAVVDQESKGFHDEGRGQQKANSAGESRKGREINADCACLPELMDMMLATAGGYTLGWVMYGENRTSRLSVVRTVGAGDGKGSSLFLVRGAPSTNIKTGYFTEGNFRQDATNLVTQVIGLGSLVKREARVDTYLTAYIKKRWSAERETELKDMGKKLKISDATGMVKLFTQFPGIYETWQIADDWNFLEGTSESAYPRAPIRRPILPYLLSWLGGKAMDYAAQRHPVRVETSFDQGKTWKMSTTLHGLEIWDDGTIYIPALKELALGGDNGSWFWGANEAWDFSKLTAADIRMTIALPMDHRLTAVAKMVQDNVGAQAGMNVDTPDVSRIDKGFTRQKVLDLRGLYDLWLRKDSWAFPEDSEFGTKMLDDKPTRDNPLRNDQKLLEAHVRRRQFMDGRLKRGGMFRTPGVASYLCSMLGAEVSKITSLVGGASITQPVACVRSAIRMVSESGRVFTEVYLE